MANCKKIQNLILTDYLDGEMDKSLVEKHIASCKDCKRFLGIVEKTTVKPLENAKKLELDQDAIWTKIQGQIREEENESIEYLPEITIFDQIKQVFFSLKSAFVVLGLIVLFYVIFVSNFNNNKFYLVKDTKDIVDSNTMDSYEDLYLAYFQDQSQDYEDYGSDLEEYFL